jgi:spermidine synthase
LVRVTPPWHHQLMASGAYYYAASYDGTDARSLSRELQREARLLYYEDGLTATVTVTQDLRSRDRDLYISTNGKLDGSSHYDMPTQRVSAHLPLLVHPSPREVAVIGMGTGTTAGSAGLHPVDRVTVVEIEAAMVEGARWFREHNNAVHENPRVDIRISDGRLFLNYRPDSFDVIISEPSNPWLAGASDLFTQEFFRLGARALRQDGVFAQWLQLYGMAPENVQIVVRTFASVFPYVYLASTIPDSDVLLLGAMHPLDLDPKRIEAAMLAPGIREDLADPRVGVRNVYDLLARVRMGPDAVRALAGEGVLHTDDLPIIAYRAPRDLYKDTRQANMAQLARLSRGIAPRLDLSPTDRKQAAAVLERLAAAYEAFLPGGNEAQVTRTLAVQAGSQSLPLNAEENSLEP